MTHFAQVVLLKCGHWFHECASKKELLPRTLVRRCGHPDHPQQEKDVSLYVNVIGTDIDNIHLI
jgi:hypothetical protein